MDKIKIILVDDNQKFRESIQFYLEEILHYEVIAEAFDGEAFLNLDNLHVADIVLMDISMPKLNGMKAAKMALQNNKLNIIAVTSYEDKTYLNELIESGIKGCVFKKDIHDNLKDAILSVKNGELFFPKSISLKLKDK